MEYETVNKEKYLTIEQAAASVDKHAQTIRRWIHDGKLPARKLGREYRIAESDLEAMYEPLPFSERSTVEA
jgi:excisionase family DNA binding protein